MDKAARASHEGVQNATAQVAAAKKLLAEKSEELESAQGAFEAAEVRAPVAGVIVGTQGRDREIGARFRRPAFSDRDGPVRARGGRRDRGLTI